MVISGTAWGLICHLTAAGGGGRGEREQLAGALPVAAAESGLFWEGGPQRGRHLHFKGVGPGFPTLGTWVYSGENHVALSELPTRAHPFLDRRAALNNPGS